MIDVPGYSCYRKDRPSRRGGGVMIYIKDHGRKFHLTVGGDNKYKISHEQFLKGTQIIQSNCTYKDMSPQ